MKKKGKLRTSFIITLIIAFCITITGFVGMLTCKNDTQAAFASATFVIGFVVVAGYPLFLGEPRKE